MNDFIPDSIRPVRNYKAKEDFYRIIKFKEKNPKSQDPLKWGGTNFLGFQITRVRDFIVSQNIM